MAIYSTGTVKVKAGSAKVHGSGTDFNTYAAQGYLFRLTTDNTFYDVAAVTDATTLTLTSRYADTDYQTDRPSEHCATMTTATKMYSFVLDNTPVIQNEVVIQASIENFTDDGAGVLTGDGSPAGSGTVGYDDGAVSITLGTDLTATAAVVASYQSGDTLTGKQYQVITDYTPNFTYPEMGLNDINFPHIYTKFLRQLDADLYNASVQTVDASVVTASHLHIINNATINNLDTKTTIASVVTASHLHIINNATINNLDTKTTIASVVTASHIDSNTATILTAKIDNLDTKTTTASIVTATNIIGNTLGSFLKVKTPNVVADTLASAPTVRIGTKLKMGAHQYLLFGSADSEAAVVAEATAVDASCKGSLYLSTAGQPWFLTSDSSASVMELS